MFTELMIALIVVGCIMVFIVWNTSRNRRKRAEEQRLVEESTTKLKNELEKTASEVIQRMETQAANLENLLEDAERNRTEFEGRLAELKNLIKRGENQSIEIRDLLQKLEDAGEDVEDLQQKLETIEMKISTTLSMPLQVPMHQPIQQSIPQPMIQQPMMQQPMMQQPMMQPMVQSPMAMSPQMMRQVPSPISPPPILRQSHYQQEQPVQPTYRAADRSIERSAFEEERIDESRDFEAVLRRSMGDEVEERPAARRSTVPDRSSIVVPSTEKQAKVVEAEPVKIESRRGAQPSRTSTTTTQRSTSTAQRQTTAQQSRPTATAQRSTTAQPMRPTATAQRPAATAQPRQATAQQSRPTATATAQRQTTAQPRQATVQPSVQPTQPTQQSQPSRAAAGSEPNAMKIKNLLLEGKTVEEIARELGMGRGAVELVQEMTRRKLERKKSP
ncbi:MAG: hypothetical protein IJ668_06590 [Selenomonadaceae bacterium]|nr:hypothetical protein [Selenomonadaceae bacterium]